MLLPLELMAYRHSIFKKKKAEQGLMDGEHNDQSSSSSLIAGTTCSPLSLTMPAARVR